MIRSRRIACAIAAWGVGVFTAYAAAAVTPQDFATGRKLSINGGAALGVYTLPLDVLAAVKGDLKQVAVFNQQGNVVPFAFRVPEAERGLGRSQNLPLFPIFAVDTSKRNVGANVEVTTQKDGTLARVYVSNAEPTEDAAQPSVVRYLVDASAIVGSIEELSFVVRAQGAADADFTWTLQLAAGDSLDHLTRVTYSGTLAKLTHQGTSLNVASIETSGLQERYIAITWDGKAPGIIERVEALVSAEKVGTVAQTTELVPTRLTLSEPAKSTGGNIGTPRVALVYDAQAILPLQRVQFALPEANTLASIDVYVASEPPQGPATLGTRVYSGNVYRLTHNGATFESAPIAVNRSERYITVTANQAASEAQLGLNQDQATGWPRLALHYSPTQALFVLSGAPPFTLAYGSYQPSQALSAAEILAVNVSLSAGQMGDNVTADESFVLGSPSAPQTPVPWQRIGLWAVLVVAVGVLLVMTRGLLRRVGS